MERKCREYGMKMCGIAGLLVLGLTACSSDQPKPMVQPTSDQVRGHADRAFDKLKQEEAERAAQPPGPR